MSTDIIRELTADIVSAYVRNNPLARTDIVEFVASVAAAINSLGQPMEPEKPELVPAVPIRKSVTADYLISLEDGKQYKSLRRHLTGRGLTPDEYREKWGLPADYPMVSQNYSAARSELARKFGLGRKPAAEPEPAPAAKRTRKAK